MLVLRFSESFLLTTSLRRRRISLYVSLITVSFPANYTSKFWELFEAAEYIGSLKYLFVYLCLYISVCICTQEYIL